MISSQKLMIMLAASSMAINAGDNATESLLTSETNEINEAKTTNKCAGNQKKAAPSSLTNDYSLFNDSSLFNEPSINTGYISPVDSSKLSLSAVTQDLEEVLLTPTPQLVTKLEDTASQVFSTSDESSSLVVSQASSEPAEDAIVTQDLQEARTPLSTPQLATTLADFALEELNNDNPNAGDGIFSRTASQASSEPAEDVVVTQDLQEARTPLSTPQLVITLEDTNSQVFSASDESLSPVVSQASSESEDVIVTQDLEEAFAPTTQQITTKALVLEDHNSSVSRTGDLAAVVQEASSEDVFVTKDLEKTPAVTPALESAASKKAVEQKPWYMRLYSYFS